MCNCRGGCLKVYSFKERHKQPDPAGIKKVRPAGLGWHFWSYPYIQGGSKRMAPVESDCKENLDIYFQIYQEQLLSLTLIAMIISNNYFRWLPTFLAIAFKSLGADENIFYKSDQLRVWTVLFLKPLN